MDKTGLYEVICKARWMRHLDLASWAVTVMYHPPAPLNQSHPGDISTASKVCSMYGPVMVCPNHGHYYDADKHSSNTAWISAFIHAMEWVKRCKPCKEIPIVVNSVKYVTDELFQHSQVKKNRHHMSHAVRLHDEVVEDYDMQVHESLPRQSKWDRYTSDKAKSVTAHDIQRLYTDVLMDDDIMQNIAYHGRLVMKNLSRNNEPSSTIKRGRSHVDEDSDTDDDVQLITKKVVIDLTEVGDSSTIQRTATFAGFVQAHRPVAWYEIFTDGSCIGNTGNCDAGWGVLVTEHQTLMRSLNSLEDLGRVVGAQGGEGVPSVSLYGQVVTHPELENFVGARVGTNNTGELSAIIHAMQWVEHRSVPKAPVVIRSDSLYAMKVIQGVWDAKKNVGLVRVAKDLLQKLRGTRKVHFSHVKAHCGIPWNEKADELANKGRTCVADVTWKEVANPTM